MGDIASYYVKGKTCICHLCGDKEFQNKGAIRQHFIASKKHWQIRNPKNKPNLDSYFDEIKRSNEISEIRGNNTNK